MISKKQIEQPTHNKIPQRPRQHKKVKWNQIQTQGNKKVKQSKLEKISSKVFWNHNMRSDSTIEKVKERSASPKPNQKIHVFKEDQIKFEKVRQANLKCNQLSLPVLTVLRGNSNTMHVQKGTKQKHKKSQKKPINYSSIEHQNFIELTPAEQSSIMQQRYRQRCKNQSNQFHFECVKFNDEPIKRKKVKQADIVSMHAPKDDISIPRDLVQLFKLKK